MTQFIEGHPASIVWFSIHTVSATAEDYFVRGHKLGILCGWYNFMCSWEIFSAYVGWYGGIFWFNRSKQNSALWLTLALPSPDIGRITLTHWGRDKMDAISQTPFSSAFFFNENIWISIKISLKFVPKSPINNIPALVQIIAWCRPGDKPLSEAMMVNLPTHICVSRS